MCVEKDISTQFINVNLLLVLEGGIDFKYSHLPLNNFPPGEVNSAVEDLLI